MKKDIVLFVNAVRPATFDALDKHHKITGQKLTPVVIVDEAIHKSISKRNGQHAHADKVTVIVADLNNPYSVREALQPIQDRIMAVTCQYENSVHELKKIVPYLPYLPTPSELSLSWATEKKHMRDMLGSYDRKLVPGYIEASDASPETIQTINNALNYPVMIKPSGLEGSLLVTKAENEQELAKVLPYVFQEIQNAYDTWIKRQTPVVLVEEFMAGDMFSVDVYVDSSGECSFTPVVKVITGHKIGFEDFFGYMRLAPSGLSSSEEDNANNAAKQAVHALGLRSVTAHVELMLTQSGWKIIELGPRIGGYRHDLYDLAYGINHIVNDILNRAGQTVTIPTQLLQKTAVFNICAPDEGKLNAVNGLDTIRELESFVSLRQVVELGGPALFAKNNGDPILEVIMSNKNHDTFDQDVKTLEDTIEFVVD